MLSFRKPMFFYEANAFSEVIWTHIKKNILSNFFIILPIFCFFLKTFLEDKMNIISIYLSILCSIFFSSNPFHYLSIYPHFYPFKYLFYQSIYLFYEHSDRHEGLHCYSNHKLLFFFRFLILIAIFRTLNLRYL